MNQQPPTIFYFWYRCDRGCSWWLENTDSDEDVARWPATCVYDGSPLVEVGSRRRVPSPSAQQ